MIKKKDEITAVALKEKLWGALRDYEAKKITSEQARDTALLARGILNVTTAEIKFTEVTKLPATESLLEFMRQEKLK